MVHYLLHLLPERARLVEAGNSAGNDDRSTVYDSIAGPMAIALGYDPTCTNRAVAGGQHHPVEW